MPDLRALLLATPRNPRVVARMLMDMGLPMQARLLGLGLVVIGSAVLGTLAKILFSVATKLPTGPAEPLPLALMQGAMLIYGAAVLTLLGRIFDGRGRFADALLLLTWIEFVLLVGQAVQVLLMVIFPLSASFLALLLIGLMVYLLVQFTMELHGYENVALTALGVVLGFMVAALVAGVVLMGSGLVEMPVLPQG